MNILGTFRSSGVLPSASSRFVTDGAHDAFIHGADSMSCCAVATHQHTKVTLFFQTVVINVEFFCKYSCLRLYLMDYGL